MQFLHLEHSPCITGKHPRYRCLLLPQSGCSLIHFQILAEASSGSEQEVGGDARKISGWWGQCWNRVVLDRPHRLQESVPCQGQASISRGHCEEPQDQEQAASLGVGPSSTSLVFVIRSICSSGTHVQKTPPLPICRARNCGHKTHHPFLASARTIASLHDPVWSSADLLKF